MTLTTELDLRDPGFVADPYPALAELRSRGPLLRHEPTGRWLATTHASVSAVLRHRGFGRIWTDWEPAERMDPFNALHRHQMMENEPPEHTRLRRAVATAFGRGHVERLGPRVAELADAMLDAIDPSAPVDVLAAYAEPMPVYVIADLLGVPRDDHARLRDWSQAIVHMYEVGVDDATRDAAVEASVAFADYVRGVVAHKRRAPGDDLVSHLVEEGSLSDDELVASVALLLNAGHEASVNVFGNGLHALLEHRDQLDRVTAGEVSVATALEELIRYDAPLQLFERTATTDVEVAGQVVAAGETVACLMGSANRDEEAFAAADTFDVGRDPNPHVGFGMGRHFCLGAPLARLELEITVRRLLERFPRLDLHRAGSHDPAPRRPTWVLRGFASIEVDLT
ncbi:MAG: cytochrome P450 [Aeromicrobium erythreum]